MDAIGLSVGLAGATFAENEGYTIFAGSFISTSAATSASNMIVISKTFANPVQGIMGWFGSNGNNSDASLSLANATTSFYTNIAAQPTFICPDVYYGSNMAVSGGGASSFFTTYTAGSSTTINFYIVCGKSSYAALCCYLYIFF